jgi:hypothetical protein
MERCLNLIIPDFCKETLSHYSVCNNIPQYIELWVLLGTALNCQGHRNVTVLSMAVVMERGYFFFNVMNLILILLYDFNI